MKAKIKIRVGKYEQEIDFGSEDVEIVIEGKHHIWRIERRKRNGSRKQMS